MRMRALSVLTMLGLSRGPATAETELRNDSFESGQTVVAHGGFAPGEIAASRFFVATPSRLLAVRLIFARADMDGGAATDVTLHVWQDDQTGVEPGVELYNGDFTITPSQTNLQELSVITENITVAGYFRVGVEVHHRGQPSITNDTNGVSSVVNNLLKETSQGWQFAAILGVSGDWIIRAVVADGGGTPDAGTGGPDAGTGGPDASTGGPDAGTGGDCNGNGDCEIGEYCDTAAHACTFDCRHDSDCPNDGECNSLGQCVGATDGGGGCCSTGEGSGAGGALGALGLAGLVGAVVTRRRRREDRAGTGSRIA
jgi:MYXO-CTERM domain-containing protein